MISRNTLRAGAFALAACIAGIASPAVAWAQSIAGILPQNVVDRPLSPTAYEMSNMTVRKAVLVMRHGVRPPTSTPKLQVYSNNAFPTTAAWGVVDGNLTAPGAVLAQALGSIDRALYSAKGLLSPTGCPRPGDLFVWADNATQRTQATGQAFVTGLYNGCGLTVSTSASATADPLFTPPFSYDPNAAMAAVLARAGGSFAPLQAYLAPTLQLMNPVINCCSTTLCTQSGLSAGCQFSDLPPTLTISAGTLSFGGAIGNGSGIAEEFELEYADGLTGTNLAFGNATEAQITSLMKIYTTKYDFFERTPLLARNKGSNIAQQLLYAVEQGAGLTTAGPPNALLTVYVGHDSTISALGGMLNLHWALPTYQPDDMPPTGALGFELLSDTTGAFYVRPIYLTMTLDAMRASVPQANFKAPIYESLQLTGCEFDSGRLCSLGAFIKIMNAAIDPTATAPFTYQ